jgi:hypothetical protein
LVGGLDGALRAVKKIKAGRMLPTYIIRIRSPVSRIRPDFGEVLTKAAGQDRPWESSIEAPSLGRYGTPYITKQREMTMPETEAQAFVRALRESSDQTTAYLRSVHAAAGRAIPTEETVSPRASSARSKPSRPV